MLGSRDDATTLTHTLIRLARQVPQAAVLGQVEEACEAWHEGCDNSEARHTDTRPLAAKHSGALSMYAYPTVTSKSYSHWYPSSPPRLYGYARSDPLLLQLCSYMPCPSLTSLPLSHPFTHTHTRFLSSLLHAVILPSTHIFHSLTLSFKVILSFCYCFFFSGDATRKFG